MSLLISVKSCERDCKNGWNQAIRDTWGKQASNLGVDVRFFVGIGDYPLQEDETRVYAPDDYDGLPWKTLGICRWAKDKHYDFLFLCDTDTFVLVDRLLACGYERYDLAGYFHDSKIPGSKFKIYRDDRGIINRDGWYWPSGGVGYTLSKKAIIEVANQSKPSHWAEDFSVGQIIGQAGDLTIAGLQNFHQNVSWHFNQHHRGSYSPEWMHNAFKNGAPF